MISEIKSKQWKKGVFISFFMIMLTTNSWAAEVKWKDYRKPLSSRIRIREKQRGNIEKVPISVTLPADFLRKHEKISLSLELESNTARSFGGFSPCFIVNGTFICLKVKQTKSKQKKLFEIQKKHLKSGKNILEATFKWKSNGYYCNEANSCGYTIHSMSFRDAPKAPTPKPTSTPRPRRTSTPRPTATPTPSPIISLLKKADEYFEKKWFLTPKETNAFDAYKKVLEISISNMHAREKLYDIMKSYKTWGDNNYDEGNYEKAKSYYERYMIVANYIRDELRFQMPQNIERGFKNVSERLELIENPPTPTPAPEPLIDELPRIEIATELPEEIDAEELSIQGLVKDDLGVAEIHFILNGEPGETLQFSSEESSMEQPFEKIFLLAPGENNIVIKAVDAKGQNMRQEVRLIRTMLPEATPLPPTPTPALIDEYPEIDLLSDIPDETNEAYIQLKGRLKDDRGIEDFKISIRRPNSTWFEVLRNVEFDGENFSADIRLDIGETGLLLVATDTIGQATKKEFTLLRKQNSGAGPLKESGLTREVIEQEVEKELPSIKRYVILVGAEEYLDERISPYQCAQHDIQQLYDFFTDPERGNLPEEHIKLLQGKDVTERDLKKTFGKWLREQDSEQSRILLYFIGYGAYAHGEAYWISYDTELDDIFSTSLSLKKIKKALSRLQAKTDLIFIDALFLEADSIKTTEPLWNDLTSEQRAVIGSSNGRVTHTCTDEQQSRAFTASFLRGLEGSADLDNDTEIRTGEIWEFLSQENVDSEEHSEIRPVLLGELSSETLLTLAKPPSAEERKDKIVEVYRSGQISAEQFQRALNILKNGESDRILEGFLAEKISLEIFQETF